MINRVPIIMLISLFATIGFSQTMFGYANSSCIEFLEEHKKRGEVVEVVNWINGYFSGRIRETGREMEIVNKLNIPLYDLLRKACINEPTLAVREAADIVYYSIP